MKFLHRVFLVCSILWTSIVQAEPLVLAHIEGSLAKVVADIKEEMVDRAVLRINKELKKPDVLLSKYKKKYPEVSELRPKDLAQMKAIKHKGDIRLYYTQDRYVTASLKKLERGIVLIDKREIPLEQLKDPKRVRQIIEESLVYKGARDGKGLLAFLIKPAHAISFLLGPAVLAWGIIMDLILGLVDVDFKRVQPFERMLHQAIVQCQRDLKKIVQGLGQDNQKSEVEKTVDFIRKINRFSTSEAKKYDGKMLSCGNIKKEQGIERKSLLLEIRLKKLVGNMCELAQELEKCLQEVNVRLEERGVSINDSTREAVDPFVPYETIIDGLNKSKSIAR